MMNLVVNARDAVQREARARSDRVVAAHAQLDAAALRRARGQRRRPGHPARDPRARVRAVLHDEDDGPRARHGARPRDGVRHRREPRRRGARSTRPRTAAARRCASCCRPRAAPPSDSSHDRAASVAAGTGTILVVDDDDDRAPRGRDALAQARLQTIEAASGAEAVEIYRDAARRDPRASCSTW